MYNKNFINWSTTLIGPLCLFILIISYFTLSVNNGYLMESENKLVGRDLINMWQYGIAAFTENPELNYNPDIYNAKLDQIIPGVDYTYQQWSYPPHFMLLAAPFGLMGYNLFLAIFLVSSLVFYWIFIVKPFEAASIRLALVCSPVLMFCLISGNLSVFLAALLVTVFRQMDKRPILAGVLIALLTVKPQIGFLFPIFLLATGRYKVFGVAAISTLVFIGSSILVHGVAPWETYLQSGIGRQALLATGSHEVILSYMPTLTSNLGILGVSIKAGMLVQLAVAIPLVLTMIWICRSQKDPFLQFGVFLTVSFAVTPYLMGYDTLVLGWLMLSLLSLREAHLAQKTIYVLLMTLPLVGLALIAIGLTGTYLIIFGLAVWMIKVAWPSSSESLGAKPKISA